KNLAQDGFLKQPANYQSDYVWNYEVGTKNRIGPLVIEGSVYDIHWSNIQTFLYLPACAYGITINAGHVDSKGVDLAAQLQAFQTAGSNLMLSGAWGYNDAKFSENTVTPSGKVLYYQDTGVPNAGAPITLSFIADYNFHLTEGAGAYLHYDWSHLSAERRAGSLDPINSNYNP